MLTTEEGWFFRSSNIQCQMLMGQELGFEELLSNHSLGVCDRKSKRHETKYAHSINNAINSTIVLFLFNN